MFRQIVNWRTALALIAISIVIGTIFYSRYLADKIAKEEKSRVTAFGEALKMKAIIMQKETIDPQLLEIADKMTKGNEDIPIIETDEKDKPTDSYINLDSVKVNRDSNYLKKKVKDFSSRPPVIVVLQDSPLVYNKYFYGDSKLLDEVRYYPLVQLAIVALFIIITIFSLRSSYRSVQNQLWTGMAKETAHQLGTPVSSLEGWVEMLRDKPGNEKIAQELEKDVNRLRLVSDRFGKIGSTPQLENVNLVSQINSMVDYMRKRAAGKIVLKVDSHGKDNIIANVSPPLFDWVVENLLKNALDAMEGKGSITADIQEDDKKIYIDITDTGKGISRQNIANVFKPGFTTKRRGWGLGLSLSRRIIEQFHKGEIFVKNSEIGKGTTFRIVLKK